MRVLYHDPERNTNPDAAFSFPFCIFTVFLCKAENMPSGGGRYSSRTGSPVQRAAHRRSCSSGSAGASSVTV